MGELAKLPNIGRELERQLNEAGIAGYDALKEMGSKEAWLRIQSSDESACLHRLLALEGAVRRVKKSLLPEEVKEELRGFYREHKV